MNDKDVNLSATALVTTNSISYVKHVFSFNQKRRPFVHVADESHIKNLSGISVDKCVLPDEEFGWFSEHHDLIQDNEPAQVIYTSGTEGLPKGIVLTYANLADTANRIITEMQITSDIREYVGVPATFSFGMGRFRVISAVGGKAYLPPRGFDPMELARMLSSGEVNALSAVPTLLRILLATPDVIGESGKNLRWLEIGSQYMTAEEKREIRAIFPYAKIVQHYGLTEASRSTFLNISDISDEFLESIGIPVGKTEVEITDNNCIKIRGPHVAKWRIDADGLHDLLDSEGWFLTSDRGHIKDGYFYFDGRVDDLINCGGVKINPDLLESRIRVMLGQDSKIAIAKVPDELRGEGVLVVIERNSTDLASLKEASISALKEIGVDAGASLHIKSVESIPKTATGKTQRRILTGEFLKEKELSPKGKPQPVPVDESINVLGFFEHMFPGQTIDTQDNFEILGGDSLSYIRFSLNFEKRFGALPDKWEEWSVSQLQQHVNSTEKSHWRRLEAPTLTRAIGMMLIVALHFETFIYSSNWGAAYFLFMLSGYSMIRFQLPEINRTGSVKVLFGTILRIAIPTIMVLIVLQLKHTTFELRPLLLISNFFDPSQYQVMYYYFIEIYIQLLLLAALLFSVARIREFFRKEPMLSSIILLLIVSTLDKGIGIIWNTEYLYDRPVHNWMWCFACGIVMASANNLYTRLIAMTVILIATWIFWGFTPAMFWVSGACAVLLFVREIWVMSPVKIIIAEIAGASIFIYLSHYHLIPIASRIFGDYAAWPGFLIALVFGIAFTHAYDWSDARVRRMMKFR